MSRRGLPCLVLSPIVLFLSLAFATAEVSEEMLRHGQTDLGALFR